MNVFQIPDLKKIQKTFLDFSDLTTFSLKYFLIFEIKTIPENVSRFENLSDSVNVFCLPPSLLFSFHSQREVGSYANYTFHPLTTHYHNPPNRNNLSKYSLWFPPVVGQDIFQSCRVPCKPSQLYALIKLNRTVLLLL